MNILNTQVFSIVANIFQTFWSDPVGKVFLTTALAYSASYMLYSSYISWFAGGYGGILLGQLGFTAADFLSIFPTSLLLLFVSIWRAVKLLVKAMLIYFVIPVAIGYLIVVIRMYSGFMEPNQSTLLPTIGLLIYFVGLGLSSNTIKFTKNRPAIPITVSYVGAILTSLTLSSTTTPVSPNTSPSFISMVTIFLNELIALMLVVYSIAAPSLIGLSLASFAVNEELLSKVSSLILKQPIQIAGLRIQKKTRQSKVRDHEGGIVSLNAVAQKPVYLISSFSRVTALYLPPETVGAEHGRMHLLANDLICSIEVEGRKKENEDRVPL